MGRHSASYIAAQQGHSARRTGAAAYVGRVGSLAVALGIGAAVAGGAGIAHADGSTDGDTGGGTPDTSTTKAAATSATESTIEAPTTGSSDVTTHESGPITAPTMQLGNGRNVPAAGGLESLPGLIAGIPQRIVAAFAPHPSTAGGTGSTPESTPTTPAAKNRSHDTADGQPQNDPAPADPTPSTDSFTARVADAAAAAVGGEVPPVRITSSPAATIQPVARSVTNSLVAVPVTPTPIPANPIATVVSTVLSALGLGPTATSGGSPTPSLPLLQGVLQLVRREIELIALQINVNLNQAAYTAVLTNPTKSVATGVLSPGDQEPTTYGNIGKWMLEPGGDISDYGGQPYGGKTLLEPVNVIIVDPTSGSKPEATAKLNSAMYLSGFPAQPIHSTGFQGTIDDVTYGQQPTGFFEGYSDNLFIFPNDHGRIFGPDPVQTSTGYVWSGAFNTEQLGIYQFLPTHTYVSSNMARNALAMKMILSGQATYGGMVPLKNSVDTASTTTGDHDGYAVVLILR